MDGVKQRGRNKNTDWGKEKERKSSLERRLHPLLMPGNQRREEKRRGECCYRSRSFEREVKPLHGSFNARPALLMPDSLLALFVLRVYVHFLV